MTALALPSFFPLIQYAQAGLAVLVFALSIHPATKLSRVSTSGTSIFLGVPPALSFTLFTTIWTFLLLLYLLFTKLALPKAYSTRLDLGLQFLTMSFWLVHWTWNAALSAMLESSGDVLEAVKGLVLAGTVVGLVEWLLFVATFGLMVKAFLGFGTASSASETELERGKEENVVEDYPTAA